MKGGRKVKFVGRTHWTTEHLYILRAIFHDVA